MQKIFKPMEVDIDNEETDDGFFSLDFVFNRDPANAPNYLGLCRDVNEAPHEIYIEVDDQIHGFYTRNAEFTMDRTVFTLTLLDENRFFWNSSSSMAIELDPQQVDAVNACLHNIFAI